MKMSMMKTAILLSSKVALTPPILAVLSSSNRHGKTNNQSVYFTRKWEDCGVVSDLWHHLRKHLGRNATNYFMYQLYLADHTGIVAFTAFKKKCSQNKLAVIPFMGHF